MRAGCQIIIPVRRIIPEGQGFFDIDNGVKTESVQAFVQPPVDHAVDLFTKLRVFPVQIRLLFMEYMKIIDIIMARQFVPD